MRRKVAAALCLAAFCLAVSSLIGASAQPTAKPATPATLVAGSNNATRNHPFYSSIKDLMESIIDPSADTLWGAVGTIVDTEGVHELVPKTQHCCPVKC